MDALVFIAAFILAGAIYTFDMAVAIDCYKCTSIDGESEACEDKFERGMKTAHLIKRSCHYGEFKGTHCFKFKGELEDGKKITVRDCTDEDWGSHCGPIRYKNDNGQEQRIHGCLAACPKDGCNGSSTAPIPSLLKLLAVSASVAFIGRNLWRTTHA